GAGAVRVRPSDSPGVAPGRPGAMPGVYWPASCRRKPWSRGTVRFASHHVSASTLGIDPKRVAACLRAKASPPGSLPGPRPNGLCTTKLDVLDGMESL